MHYRQCSTTTKQWQSKIRLPQNIRTLVCCTQARWEGSCWASLPIKMFCCAMRWGEGDSRNIGIWLTSRPLKVVGRRTNRIFAELLWTINPFSCYSNGHSVYLFSVNMAPCIALRNTEQEVGKTSMYGKVWVIQEINNQILHWKKGKSKGRRDF